MDCSYLSRSTHCLSSSSASTTLNPIRTPLFLSGLFVATPQTLPLSATVSSLKICNISHLSIMLHIRSAFWVFIAYMLALGGSKYFATSFLGFGYPNPKTYLITVLHIISSHQERCPLLLLLLSEVALVANALLKRDKVRCRWPKKQITLVRSEMVFANLYQLATSTSDGPWFWQRSFNDSAQLE